MLEGPRLCLVLEVRFWISLTCGLHYSGGGDEKLGIVWE